MLWEGEQTDPPAIRALVPSPREEAAATIAFSNGIAEFCFGRDIRQVAQMREHIVHQSVPSPIKLECDPELAEAVRKYLISYYAGNKDAEMMERSVEAIAYMGVGAGLDKVLVLRDTGKKWKTARSILRRTTFGSRASLLSGSISTKDDEARQRC